LFKYYNFNKNGDILKEENCNYLPITKVIKEEVIEVYSPSHGRIIEEGVYERMKWDEYKEIPFTIYNHDNGGEGDIDTDVLLNIEKEAKRNGTYGSAFTYKHPEIHTVGLPMICYCCCSSGTFTMIDLINYCMMSGETLDEKLERFEYEVKEAYNEIPKKRKKIVRK
jgi:hypothetical protein